MKEHPIIFSGPMVRAILDGRKTQTRRVLNFQPADVLPMRGQYAGNMWVCLEKREENIEDNRGHVFRCRYGNPGDRLWVRESMAVEQGATKSEIECGHFTYKADDRQNLWTKETGFRVIPSIFMPRWASRINLEIVSIRVERVQDITQEDVPAEGIKHTVGDGYWLAPLAGVPDYPWGHARLAFASLWDSINAKKGKGWDSNPWIWAIEFKRA